MTEHAHERHTVERLHRFSDAASTNRLDLLRAIEQTLDALMFARGHVSTLIDNGELLIESIETSPMTSVMDPSGELTEKLEATEVGLREEAIPALIHKREAAYKDPNLQGDYEDGIVSAYDDVITLIEKLHDATVRLRWAVMEHDADLEEPTGETFDSPADLARSLLG